MNALRGEITLMLGGTALTLRPTFAALAEMETKTGASLIVLARRLTEGSITLQELHSIVAAGMRGAGEPVPADLPARIQQTGVLPLLEPLLNFMLGAISGEMPSTQKETADG